MPIESFKCLVIDHYDGSTVEAYRLSHGDSYRLQLRNKGEFWTWKFSNNQDNKNYLSRESALIACINYLFRRILQLSAIMEMQGTDRLIHEDVSKVNDKYLPTKFKSVDSIEIHGHEIDFIDILKSENKFYAFYSNCTFSGPYPSENELLKDALKRMSNYSDSLMSAIRKINSVLLCLDL